MEQMYKGLCVYGPKSVEKKFPKGPIGILILLRTVKQDFLHFAMSNTSGMGLFVPKSEIFIWAFLGIIMVVQSCLILERNFNWNDIGVPTITVLLVLYHKWSHFESGNKVYFIKNLLKCTEWVHIWDLEHPVPTSKLGHLILTNPKTFLTP
jgi:hypothetical protein